MLITCIDLSRFGLVSSDLFNDKKCWLKHEMIKMKLLFRLITGVATYNLQFQHKEKKPSKKDN